MQEAKGLDQMKQKITHSLSDISSEDYLVLHSDTFIHLTFKIFQFSIN